MLPGEPPGDPRVTAMARASALGREGAAAPATAYRLGCGLIHSLPIWWTNLTSHDILGNRCTIVAKVSRVEVKQPV